jgi:hypothetical protein
VPMFVELAGMVHEGRATRTKVALA